jgi:NADPH:quinone reductase-like Zn-dependent oxidoreductase
MLYRKVDFADEVLRLTKRRGVDLVFEHIGPDTWDRSVRCLARGGRLVTCGATSGPKVGLELRYCFTKELSVLGCYMGSRRELQEVMVWVNKGRLKPVLDSVFPLHEAAKAQAVMESRNFFGKLVLKVKA